MTIHTKMSEKGQVVIPKDVRDRLRLRPGDRLEVVERADGLLLRRPVNSKSGKSTDEILAEIRKLYTHTGPPVTIEEMDQAIAKMWAKGGPDWDQ